MDMLMRGAPRRELVRILLDVPAMVFKRIPRGEMYDLLQCIEWMQIDHTSTSPVAPYYDHVNKKGSSLRLYLPGKSFQNVTALEYALLDDSYRKFRPDLNTDYEAQMIAVMLRPAGEGPDTASDPRIQLKSRAQANEWLPAVRALPEAIRTYMTTLVSANRQFIHDAYGDYLFPEAPPIQEGQEEQEEQAEGLDFGWWGVMMDVAQDRVFGNYDQVLQTPIHLLCMYMSKKIEAARVERQEHEHALARAGMSH